MAASKRAFFLSEPDPTRAESGLWPENPPAILWGQGTPAAIEPFTRVNKGSLYLQVNATDDLAHVWQKVDEGGDTADWVELLSDTSTLGYIPIVVTSELFDISAADSEQVIFTNNLGITLDIKKATLIYNEATTASGAAEGDITIGTTTGGAEIVAATAFEVSKATGYVKELTLVATTLTNGQEIFVSHDVAASAAGTVLVQIVLGIGV